MSGFSKTTKVLFGGLCTLGVGFTSTNLLFNTLLLNEYKDIVQLSWWNGDPMPVPEKVLKTINTVMDDLQMSPRDRERVKPFMVYGFDTFHAGSIFTKYGGILGIPSNFSYTSAEDLDKDETVKKSLMWQTSTGQNCKQSMVLSEEAQKFLIAREIVSINLPYVLLKPMYPLSSLLVVYGLAKQISRKLLLTKLPTIFYGIMYGLVSCFGFGIWVCLHDFTTIYSEIEADKAVSQLGEEYVRGGLEAYSKILERNIIIREMVGPAAIKGFTAVGNKVDFIMQKHLPYSDSKEYFEMLTETKPEAKV